MFKAKACLTFLLLLAVLLTSCSAAPSSDIFSDLPEDTVSYKTATVELGDFTISASSYVSPYFPDRTNYYCSYSGAYLVELFVSRGDSIKAGDTLATFSFEDNSLALQEKELSYREAQYAYDTKTQTYKDQLAALQEAVAASSGEQELQIAKLQLEKAQIDAKLYQQQATRSMQNMKSEIDEMKAQSQQQSLIATKDGVVAETSSIQPGESVRTTDTLVVAYSTDTVYYEVSSDYATLFPYAMQVTITFKDKTGLVPLTGQVIASTVGIYNMPENDNNRAIIRTDTPPASISEAGTAEGTSLTFSDILYVRKEAVYTDDSGLSFVYILEDNIPEKRYIVSGPTAEGLTCILDGLSEGQILIIS